MTYTIQLTVDAMVSFNVEADTLEQALEIGKEKLKSRNIKIFNRKAVELIDEDIQITGAYS